MHSGYTCFITMCVPWELNPQPFALLTQCSTTEPQEHSINILNTVSTSTKVNISNKELLKMIVHPKNEIGLYLYILPYYTPPPPPNCLVTSHCLHLLCELKTQRTEAASAGLRRKTEAASAGPRKTEAGLVLQQIWTTF